MPGATYSWTGPNGFVSSLQNPTNPSATIQAAGTCRRTAPVNGRGHAPGTPTGHAGTAPGPVDDYVPN